MELSLFDLHCDTPYLMLKEHQPLFSNRLAVSLESARKFKQYVQVMALWTDNALSDEDGWRRMHGMLKNLQCDRSLQNREAKICNSYHDIDERLPCLFLGVEDARILNGKPERLSELLRLGIRILTPLWRGLNCIGGSHDTDEGLTPFGKSILTDAVSKGMILDVSHASERSTQEIFEICASQARPCIASHSNAYTVCPVSRNLRDFQIDHIVQNGGLIGLNFYGAFLSKENNPSIKAIFSHIDHFLSRGAQNVLALGGDMDGCDLPYDLSNLSALPHLADLMQKYGYGDELIQKIFFGNANKFFSKYL